MENRYRRDRLIAFGLLIGLIVAIQAFYVLHVRPAADSWLVEQKALTAKDPGRQPERSLWVIIKDPEQETAIIIFLWALGLAVVKTLDLRRERRQLDAGILRLPPGFRILPTDVREHARAIENLPVASRGSSSRASSGAR